MGKVSKIAIPEFEMFGFSSMNALKAYLLLYGYEIKRIRQKYPSNSIGDLLGYKAFLLEKLMQNICTYVMVVEESQDYIVASSILRILLDGISVYNFIYRTNDKEEMLLRHYLYIIDGVLKKLDINSKYPLRRTDKITEEEYSLLAQKLSYMRKNLNQTRDFCIKAIKNLDIYLSHKKMIERLIQKGNWKFSSFDNPTTLKWKELHDRLPSEFHGLYSDLCDYLSQYVHGLSESNLILEINNKDLYEPLSANVVLILNFIQEAMINDFEVDVQFLINGLIDSPNFQAYYSYTVN